MRNNVHILLMLRVCMDVLPIMVLKNPIVDASVYYLRTDERKNVIFADMGLG